MNEKFSFVIPVYNAERFLEQCVRSILNQTYKDLEIILVDDCSTDGSGVICDTLANSDGRVLVIHKNNEGPGIARNTGVKYATGEFVIFCDADDYYSSNQFLHTLYLSIKKDTDVVVFNYANLYGNKVVPARKCISELGDSYSSGQKYLQAALHIRYDYKWFPWMFAFRKNIFERGIEFPKEKLGEDTATIYRFLLEAREVKVIKTPYYMYRRSSGNNLTAIKTYGTLSGMVDVADRCIKDISRRESISDDLKTALNSNFATAYFTALIHADKLPKEEFEQFIMLLKEKWYLASFSVSPKQVVTRNVIKMIGLKRTAVLLGKRRDLRENHK